MAGELDRSLTLSSRQVGPTRLDELPRPDRHVGVLLGQRPDRGREVEQGGLGEGADKGTGRLPGPQGRLEWAAWPTQGTGQVEDAALAVGRLRWAAGRIGGKCSPPIRGPGLRALVRRRLRPRGLRQEGGQPHGRDRRRAFAGLASASLSNQ